MKKTLSILLSALLVCCTLIPAFAADSIKAVVTVCDGSAFPALACAEVTVTDKDGDNALTVYDALYCAHEQYCKDGADGFGATATDYGLSMTKLWGNANGYGFGYYVNDAAAWSLTDPIAAGDYIAAFVYTDTEFFSDAYSFFDVKATETDADKAVALTLSKLAWVASPTDADPYAGSMEQFPVADAAILLNGKETEWKTDAEGKVSVAFDEAGTHIVSAKAAEGIIVPPACIVEVTPSVIATATDAVNAVVTICDGGASPALACADVAVTDKDDDKALTVYDALYCAHEQYYKDGAAGFGAAVTDYGLSMTKLWGNANGFGFGYYVNDASAWSLTDPVKEGDYVVAFVYTDTTYFSDAYSFFDVKATATDAGEAVVLTLSKVEWVASPTDADPYAGSMQNKPVADAVILVDGEETASKTDAEGKATLTFDAAGTHIVSAKSADGIVVPPACKAEVALCDRLGDVDLDGKLTPEDARLALRASVKLITLTGKAFEHADADKDGVITPEDARRILRASVHLEELS